MDFYGFLIFLLISGIVLATILGIELRPLLTRLDKIIHLLEKK